MIIDDDHHQQIIFGMPFQLCDLLRLLFHPVKFQNNVPVKCPTTIWLKWYLLK